MCDIPSHVEIEERTCLENCYFDGDWTAGREKRMSIRKRNCSHLEIRIHVSLDFALFGIGNYRAAKLDLMIYDIIVCMQHFVK